MIDTAALSFALGAGLVAALNPCGFAFLPGYLALVIAAGHDTSRTVALARAAVATITMALGFLTVFGVFGLAISPVIASVERYLPFVTIAIGVALVMMALWLVAGKDFNVALPQWAAGTPTARLGSMYGYGVGYAIASLSCTVGPFIAVIGTTFKQGSIFSGVLAFLAYAAGMSITVGVAAVGVAFAGSLTTKAFRRILPHVSRMAGAIVLLAGLYVTYYGYYEIRMHLTFAGIDDPIINAASRIQGWLARQADALGPLPLLLVAAVSITVVIGWRAIVDLCTRGRGVGPGSSPSPTFAEPPETPTPLRSDSVSGPATAARNSPLSPRIGR